MTPTSWAWGPGDTMDAQSEVVPQRLSMDSAVSAYSHMSVTIPTTPIACLGGGPPAAHQDSLGPPSPSTSFPPSSSCSQQAPDSPTQQQQQHQEHHASTTHSEAQLAAAASSGRSSNRPAGQHHPRKGQGYRKLWMLVNRVQRGQRLNESNHYKEDVTVEDLVKLVQALPASSSAVEAIAPGLAYLDSRALAALLKGLAKMGLGQRAVEIFDHLRELPPGHDLAPLADIFTYTTMIAQCNSHAALRRALELVGEMRGRGVPLNVHTYSALLNVALKANELELALDVYAQMLSEGVTPNLVTYNTLLEVHNKAGHWVDALKVLELLQHQGIKPEARTYNSIISTCNGAGRYAEAVRVYETMLGAGVEPNGASFNAALAAYSRSGQLEAALQLFGAMGARGFERGANTYAAMLAACEKPGRWDLALGLLQQMQGEGVRPSSPCLTSAMAACLAGGEPGRAEAIFNALCSIVRPDAPAFNALVVALCRLGKVREGANMLEVMLRSGQAVEPAALGAAIEAAWGSGVVTLQAYARQLHARGRAQGLYVSGVAKQECSEGSVLDLQLPCGSPQVVLLSLLDLLAQLRAGGPDLLGAPEAEGGSAKVLLRLPVQGHDVSVLSHTIDTQLRSLASPFVAIAPLPSAALAALAAGGSSTPATPDAPASAREGGEGQQELHYVAPAPAVAEWLQSGAVMLALGEVDGCSGTACGTRGGGGVDGLLAAQEDAARELKCRQAMLSVEMLEASLGIDPQAIPAALLPQRPELVQLLLANAAALGLPPEVGHDAVQLLDRLLSGPSGATLAAAFGLPLLAAACLHTAARQDAGAAALCGPLFGTPPAQLLLAAGAVQQALGQRGCVAISALRVLQLLLERLGVDSADVGATMRAAGRAVPLLNATALEPRFVGCSPTLMAVVVLYAARLAAGLLPAWPSALAALTGRGETDPALQPYAAAAMRLLLEL